jgi:hypothetical protein
MQPAQEMYLLHHQWAICYECTKLMNSEKGVLHLINNYQRDKMVWDISPRDGRAHLLVNFNTAYSTMLLYI